MKILIDVNLSPKWVPVFKDAGLTAVHWSEIGSLQASDHEIMQWAKANKHIVFTHDLDFGTILAATNADFPSVIQVRTQNVDPAILSDFVLSALNEYKDHLEKGALIIMDQKKSRVRILPLKS